MTQVSIFLSGVCGTLLLAVAAAAYLRPHLKSILTELCGTPERARFWTAFSNLTVILVPMIFVLSYSPEAAPGVPAVLEVAGQVKWGLVGLAGAIFVLGIVVAMFIPRERPGTKSA